jgi:hypothetical protein
MSASKANVGKDVVNMIFVAANRPRALLVHRKDAYKRMAKVRAPHHERRNLLNVRLCEPMITAHALPKLCSTARTVGNKRANRPKVVASKILAVPDAIRRALVAGDGTRIGVVHKH